MDLNKSHEWNENELNVLIENEVEESSYLEYKKCDSLKKNDREKNEVSKDVSAFANADGGIIVYGS